MRIATIDIGTVTSRLLIADVNGTSIVPLVRRAEITNIGEGTDASGCLKSGAIARTVNQIREYLSIIHSFDDTDIPVKRVVAMATSASRDASNANEFISQLEDLGLQLSVIDGTQEAELSFLGAANDFKNEQILVIDVGGGSTEVVCGCACMQNDCCIPAVTLDASTSFNIGCRRMTERFLEGNPPTAEQYNQAFMWAHETIQPFFTNLAIPDRVIAVAGTATTAVSIRDAMAIYDPDRVHRSVVTRDDLGVLFERLAYMTLEEKQQIVGLQPQRASVIVAGFIVLDVVLQCAHVDEFTVSENDILQGMALRASVLGQ